MKLKLKLQKQKMAKIWEKIWRKFSFQKRKEPQKE